MTERRTPDAKLIEAVRILSRTINTEDGVIPACLAEVATRLAELVEERRSISVGERLPEAGSLVLAFINGEVMEATFVGGKGLAWQTDRGGFNATHWMPLPPGPETKEVGDVPIQK
jgi:hypothetical protein